MRKILIASDTVKRQMVWFDSMRRRKIKIALHGWVYSENFGDLLMLDLMKQWLLEEFPNVEIVVPFASKGVSEQIGLPGGGGYIELWQSDILIFTGGGYFYPKDASDLRASLRMLRRYLFILIAARMGAIPYGIFSAGLGENRRSWLRGVLRSCLTRAEILTFRDTQARERLYKIGCIVPHNIYPDMLLAVGDDRLPSGVWYGDDFFADRSVSRTIGISVTAGMLQTEFSERFVEMVNSLLDKHSELGVVLFLDHRSHNSARLDEELQSRISGRFADRLLSLGFVKAWDLVSVIKRLDGVITSKLHVAVVALVFNIPAVSFASHPKTIDFMKSIGHPGRAVDLLRTTDNKSVEWVDDLILKKPVEPLIQKSIKCLALCHRVDILQFVRGQCMKMKGKSAPSAN